MQPIWPLKALRGRGSPTSLAGSRAAKVQELSGSGTCRMHANSVNLGDYLESPFPLQPIKSLAAR